IKDRNEAEALRGTKLFVDRDRLPKTKRGEYYEADLVGLTARDAKGKDFGKIIAVHDYGAGVFFEIGANKKDSFMLPFKKACVPQIDMKAGFAVIDVPDGWLDTAKEGES